MNGLRSDIYRMGKKVYFSIPEPYRQKILHWGYQNARFLFKGMPHFENWQNRFGLSQNGQLYSACLTDINFVEPAVEAPGRIGIHLHIFYEDLISEFVAYLKNMPFPYDLYVSVSNKKAVASGQRAFLNLPLCREVNIRRVENRGRDIAPFLCVFGKQLAGYDYIAHLHGKKSLYNKGATKGWREYLCGSLLGSEDRIRRIFTLMQQGKPCGIVYPQNFVNLPYMANTWLANRGLARIWCARLGITDIPHGYFDIATGSMFWARGDALEPLFNAGITLNDFPEETGQADGTLAHCIERLLVLSSLKSGMPPGVLQDHIHPSWSAWRLDHYMNRSYQSLAWQFKSSEIKIIAFDIFDTLLSRPLLNAETTKRIVARRIGGDAGRLYREYRALAEQHAREEKGMDVGLDEIYTKLGDITGLQREHLAQLKQMEEHVEKASLVPRRDAVRLYQDALATGKKIILITDMFLSRPLIEAVLRSHGIDAWDELFLSSEIGMRKDQDGDLYKHILARYKIEPAQFLMIGDNERSDVQIPADMGASFIHLLKPPELARGLPRFSALITDHEKKGDIDDEISLGLIVRKNFDPIVFPGYDPSSLVPPVPYHVGYSLVGPILVSFAQWILQNVRKDGMERLYFLSREGKLIKQVYDCWVAGKDNVPQSEYLVVSRRAAGVAAIETLDDILDIAKSNYYSNRLDDFLYTRFGLDLGYEYWSKIKSSLGWRRGSEVKIENRRVNHLMPLLQKLAPEIIAQAGREREGLLAYLADKGMLREGRQTVVDIGYGGSVQGFLNRLTSRKVHGYYLMTDERARWLSEKHDAFIRGCFHENVKQSPYAPLMYLYSFKLEKLLSSNDPQVEFYAADDSGRPQAHYREMHPEETESNALRQSLQEGVKDYVADACEVRRSLLPDFQPSRRTARMLMEAFLGKISSAENSLLSKIVLDDHYCGRGLVKT